MAGFNVRFCGKNRMENRNFWKGELRFNRCSLGMAVHMHSPLLFKLDSWKNPTDRSVINGFSAFQTTHRKIFYEK